MFYYTRNGKYDVEGLTKNGNFTTNIQEWRKFTESEKLSIGWGKPYNAQYEGDFVPCRYYH
jgi:hypothetical protein